MSATASLSTSEPVLRTLAPALGELSQGLRSWLDARHPDPPSTLLKARLTGIADDLTRQSASLSLDQPLLVVVFMGGTGVGKSSLLNALAGAPIASASFARPTTRDPVVYLHEAVDSKRLDPALQLCRLANHNRDSLRHKILVDTPDIDSNDLANREKLLRVLPVADVVLYVGSQEKYHDQIGWDLFLEQKRRRAFAFVLNKWDRCQVPGAGAKPDEDWLRDLKSAGFDDPLLFRTCAQHWIDHPWQGVAEPPSPPVMGEQFLDLACWLERGLDRLEVEAIKSRGVSQLLDQLEEVGRSALPPDLTAATRAVAPAWIATIRDEADQCAGILLTSMDPHRHDVERHFAERRRQLFTGFMAGYLGLVHKVRSMIAGGGWTPKLSWMPALPSVGGETPKTADVNLAAFLGKCSQEASDRHLQARHRAFADRLLLEAERLGVPARLLSDRVEAAAAHEWTARHGRAMYEVLDEVERDWVQPRGPRAWVQRSLVFLGNTLPPLVLFAAAAIILWQFFMRDDRQFSLTDVVLLPFGVVVLTMVALHVLIAFLIPMRWSALRSQFHDGLQRRVADDFAAAYSPLLGQLAEDLLADRKRLERTLDDAREVASWLGQRERAASVGQLFERK